MKLFTVAWATPIPKADIDQWSAQYPRATIDHVSEQLTFRDAVLPAHLNDYYLVGISIVNADRGDASHLLSGGTADFLATDAYRAREAWEYKARMLHTRFSATSSEQHQLCLAAGDLLELVNEYGAPFKLYKVVGRG